MEMKKKFKCACGTTTRVMGKIAMPKNNPKAYSMKKSSKKR